MLYIFFSVTCCETVLDPYMCVFHITVSLFVYVLTGCRLDAAADSGGKGVFGWRDDRSTHFDGYR